MDKKKLTAEQVALLNQPLPAEALKPHPSRKYLSVINAIYVTERLNQVFGVGSWQIRTEFVTMQGKMVVTKTTFDIPDYGIHYECYGGYLGIGAHVWKNDPYPQQHQQPTRAELEQYIENCTNLDDLKDLSANWGSLIRSDQRLNDLAAARQDEILKGGAA